MRARRQSYLYVPALVARVCLWARCFEIRDGRCSYGPDAEEVRDTDAGPGLPRGRVETLLMLRPAN